MESLGEKLAELRRKNHYTQEQLAELLGVSRQAVSKWEGNAAYPEVGKLLKMGEIYGCSMDYLLKEEDTDGPGAVEQREKTDRKRGEEYACADTAVFLVKRSKRLCIDRKSRRSLWGIPLWHISVGCGRPAKGVVAVGTAARGVVSIGLFSVGIISAGLFSVGLFAAGVLAAGLAAVGTFSGGVAAVGAIFFGVFSAGAVSFGAFSVGAVAYGGYFALGDCARGMIALGSTEAAGKLFQKTGELSRQEFVQVKELLDLYVPFWLSWAKRAAECFFGF